MNEVRSRFVVPAYRRRTPVWKRFAIGAFGGAALFAGLILVALVGWGAIELVRAFSVSFIDVLAWGLILSGGVSGVMWITNEEDR